MLHVFYTCLKMYIFLYFFTSRNKPAKFIPLFLCNMLSTKVDGYSSQRLAHVAAFGPVNLTLEDGRRISVVRSESADVESRWRKVSRGSLDFFCECLFFLSE